MAAWTTPKVDWDPDDVLSDTAFNKIENNNQFLYDERYIAGAYNIGDGSSQADVSAAASFSFAKIGITIPDGYRLIVRRLMFNLEDGGLQFEITGDDDGTLAWATDRTDDTWSGRYDTVTAITLVSNSSGNERNAYIQLGCYNNTGSPITLARRDISWALKIFVELIP